MKNVLLYIAFSISFLLFVKCKDDIIESVPEPEELYKVEGIVLTNNVPVNNMNLFLDSVKCITDSLGYFLFDSLKSQTASLKINYALYVPIDTLLNINKNLYLNLELNYKSDSFFPLSIGNKWAYNNVMRPRPDSTEIELTVEVVGIEQMANLDFYKLLYTDASSGYTDTSRYYRYMRVSGDSLFEYVCDEVQLLSLFNIPVDSHFTTSRCIFNFDVTLYDNSSHFLNYYYRSILTLGADHYLSFQKGVGMSTWATEANYYKLESYYIN